MNKLAIIFLLSSNIALAEELPPMKAGLWETVMTEGGRSTTTKHCMGDQASIREVLETTKSLMQGMCEQSEITKSGDSYISKFNCNMGVTKLEVASVITGDFNSEYTVTTKSTMNPPLMGNSGSSSSGTSKYQGACPSDMKPGDIIMDNGKKMNTMEMSQKMKSQLDKIDMNKLQQLQKQMQQMQQMNGRK